MSKQPKHPDDESVEALISTKVLLDKAWKSIEPATYTLRSNHIMEVSRLRREIQSLGERVLNVCGEIAKARADQRYPKKAKS